MISTILWFIVIGAIVGVVARLIVPGRNPMGVLLTILVGVAGAILGGAVADSLGAGNVVAFIVAVIISALGVAAMTGGGRRGWRGFGGHGHRPSRRPM